MNATRTLALKKETLVELSTEELTGIVGGYTPASDHLTCLVSLALPLICVTD